MIGGSILSLIVRRVFLAGYSFSKRARIYHEQCNPQASFVCSNYCLSPSNILFYASDENYCLENSFYLALCNANVHMVSKK